MRRISKNSSILRTIRDLVATPQYWHKDSQDRLLTRQVSCRVVTKNNTKKHSQTKQNIILKSIVHPNTSRKQVLDTELAFQY